MNKPKTWRNKPKTWRRFCLVSGVLHAVSELDGEFVRTLCGFIGRCSVSGGPGMHGRRCAKCEGQISRVETWGGSCGFRPEADDVEQTINLEIEP